MKLRLKVLYAVLAFAAIPLYCLGQVRLSEFSLKLKAELANNEEENKDKDFYTLNIMQPTGGYRSLNGCVRALFKENTFPANYVPIPEKFYHMSLMTLAIPHDGNATSYDVFLAAGDLAQITSNVLPLFEKVNFSFREIKGIGANRFIAAHYDFLDVGSMGYFLAAYELIIARFLAEYPNIWMRYGYDPLPHVSVASKKKTAEPQKAPPAEVGAGLGAALTIPKVTVDTSGCREIANLSLLHEGRKLQVSSMFFNKNLNVMEYASMDVK